MIYQFIEYLIIECYRKLDPETMTDVYNDIFLKRYVIEHYLKDNGTQIFLNLMESQRN